MDVEQNATENKKNHKLITTRCIYVFYHCSIILAAVSLSISLKPRTRSSATNIVSRNNRFSLVVDPSCNLRRIHTNRLPRVYKYYMSLIDINEKSASETK